MTYFDPDFKIHTSYHNSFFILRTPIHINGLPVQIRSTGQGPLLSFTQSGVTISVKLWEISHLVGPIFLKYGVYNVDTFYYEQCPLFQVAFPSEDLLNRFLLASEAVSSEVDSALSEIFTQRAQSSESDEALDSTPFNVQAKVELFLVTPSHEKNKAAVIHPITLSNFSVCTSLWKNSELFEFGRVFAMYCTATEKGGLAVPRIVRRPQEISPKQVAMFSIHTTVSKPLQYCWEWKPPGEGEEWKSLANGDDKFKGGGTATLMITDVQKADEGMYRCTIICNCARTAIPDALSLAEAPRIINHPQDSKDVIAEKNVTFSVQATGTQPLSYQWDFKPPGKGWQPLPGGGDRIQGVDTTTLSITGVQKSDEGSYQCTVSNSAGRDTSDTATVTIIEPVKLLDLLDELKDVNDWFYFGLYLKVPLSLLKEIRSNYRTVIDQKIDMLDQWSELVVPTWGRVVQALVGIGRMRLATHIGSKHGVHVPESVSREPIQNFVGESEEQLVNTTSVQKHKDHLMVMEEQLMTTEEHVKDASAVEAVASEERNEIKSSISQLQGELQQVTQEKMAIRRELESKKEELEALKELKDLYKTKSKEEVEKVQALQRVIDAKEEEIRGITREKKAKEAESQSLHHKVEGLKRELGEKIRELLAKTERVKELQREKDELKENRNRERHQFEMLLQQVAAQRESNNIKKAKVELCKAHTPWMRPDKLDQPENLSEVDKATQELYRKFQAILNKLTPQKFQSLAEQALELQIDTEERLRGVIDKIFTKALEEPSFSIVYANLCKVLSPPCVDWETEDGTKKQTNFRRVLLTKCQLEFEKDKKDDEDREKMLKSIDEAENPEEKKELQDKLTVLNTKSRHRSLGNVRFIGELFKLKMLSEMVMHECILRLLRSSSDVESLECFARVITTTGKDLDHQQAKPRIDIYFNRITEIIKKGKIPARIKFMLQDVRELRHNNWVTRSQQEQGLKTIDQVELRKAHTPWMRPDKLDQPEYLSKADKATQELYRKFQAILNKLTPQKFQSLAEQALELQIDTEERLRGVIDKIFTKALEELSFSIAYANLCKVLSPLCVDWETEDGTKKQTNFRRVLLTKCQLEFDKDKKDDEDREEMLKSIKEAENPEEKKELQDKLTVIETKSRRRSLGNVRFIGDLFKLKMLSETAIHECIMRLLRSSSDVESLECFARLITTTGKDLDHHLVKLRIDTYFNRITEIIKKGKIPARIKFMLQDVCELRHNNWVTRSRQEQGLKTIDQIHAEARAEEAMTKRLVAQHQAMSSLKPRDDMRIGRKSCMIVDELTQNKDFKVAIERVKKLRSPGKLHVFVRETLFHTLERSVQHRQFTGRLYHELVQGKLLSQEKLEAGLNEVLKLAEDYEIDIPRVWDYLGEILAPAVSQSTLPLSCLQNVPPALVESGKAAVLAANVLLQCKTLQSEVAVISLWSESQLQWTDLGVKDVEVFLRKQKLEFLELGPRHTLWNSRYD